MKDYTPFTPGVPVPIEFFTGRVPELKKIVETAGKSVANRSLERIFVMGERGIGKSSLCRMALVISEDQLGMLGLHVYLGGVTSLEEMARRIFERLLQKSRGKKWFGAVKAFLGNHIRQVGIFGFSLEFTASSNELKQSVSDFPYVLRNLLKKLENEAKGIIIVLDDLNGLANAPVFANWLKSFVDEVATSKEQLPLLLILSGLPERRRQLINHQPSLDRVFDIIHVKRFKESEVKEFFEKAFSKVGVRVKKEAMDLLCRFSGGHPVFMHEIGDAVFKIDQDNDIDNEDALHGIVRAAETIGAKYIEPKVLATIRSEKYRRILDKIVVDPLAHRFSKNELSKRISGDESKVLHNFLQKMKKLGVVAQPPGSQRGEYEFTSELYALYFWMQGASTQRKSQL